MIQQVEKASNNPLIGIDLGTSNGLVVAFIDGMPKIISNSLGQKTTPSVVSISEDGYVIVGQTAKDRLITHRNSTASEFKQFMGTDKVYTPEEQKYHHSSYLLHTHGKELGPIGTKAFDIGRAAFIVRQAYYVSYVDEAEPWDLMFSIANWTQPRFGSCYHYALSYVAGNAQLSTKGLLAYACNLLFEPVKKNMSYPDSPWNTLPWSLNQ